MLTHDEHLTPEDVVKSHWTIQPPQPVVSIICITYNHAKYINQCLISLLSQKTKFSFEIVIHDDNSTDGTKEIIKEYENRYPSIIKTIIQMENQYSKGVRILPMLIMPICKGDFYAICEGDDYWTDCEKLETQIDFMTRNENVMLTCHAAQLIDAESSDILTILYPNIVAGIVPPKRVILGDGGLIPTPSIIVRSNIRESIPEWWKTAHISDYPLVLKAILLGKVYAFQESWCAYRTNVNNSWNSRTQNTFNIRLAHAERMKKILIGFINECPVELKNSAKIMISEYYFSALVRTTDTKIGKPSAFWRAQNDLILIDKILAGIYLATNFRVCWIRNFFMKWIK